MVLYLTVVSNDNQWLPYCMFELGKNEYALYNNS